MKKIALSVFVVIAFILYGFYQRSEGEENHIVTANDSSSSSNANSNSTGQYRDGEYTGDSISFLYGIMQVKVVVHDGKISDVQFLKYPNDRSTSIVINRQVMPILKQEAIQAQNANVDIVSGATDSAQAFQRSLASALMQAH